MFTEVNQLADAFASKAGTLGRFVADAHSALNSKSGLAGPANILLRNAVGNGLSELGISHDLSVGFLGIPTAVRVFHMGKCCK